MKRIAFILFTLCLAGKAFAEQATWLTSLPEAAEQARREDKLVLLDFTGSDWCHWCMQLDAETFSRPAFIDYAKKNLVLVQVDFPMHKSQPGDLQKANHALKNKYDVNGFPTVLIEKPDGKVLWTQDGYSPGGPGVMIAAANQCRKAAGLPPPTATAPAKSAPVASVAAAPVSQPVAPPPKTGPTAPEPKLQGFVYSASHSTAVLDGRICEEGESVHGMKVLKISRHDVTVEWLGQVKVLSPQ